MYKDKTTNVHYPKTIKVRTEPDGWVWKVFHPKNKQETEEIMARHTSRDYNGITLEDYDPNVEESNPDWREYAML